MKSDLLMAVIEENLVPTVLRRKNEIGFIDIAVIEKKRGTIFTLYTCFRFFVAIWKF
jgi:hypothetical protein